jgi:putative salt-induced outer membrane protein YdiY
MKGLKLTLLGLMVASAYSVQAAEPVVAAPAAKKIQPIQAEAELGVILTTGNTETSSYKGKITVKQDTQNWSNKYLLDALYKEDKLDSDSGKVSTVTAEKYFASLQGNYKLNEKHSALFVYGSYSDDRFSGFEHQSSVAAGYSDQVFGSDRSFLNYNLGPGYVFNETDAGVADDSFMVRLSMDYQYKLSEHARFNQDMSTELVFEDGSNAQSKSESALTAKLMGDLSLKVSYSITHNSEVADEKENMDTTTSISIVYLF